MVKEINYPKQYGDVIGRVTSLILFMNRYSNDEIKEKLEAIVLSDEQFTKDIHERIAYLKGQLNEA
jgi:hypothetical protein